MAGGDVAPETPNGSTQPLPSWYREGMPGYVLRDWEVIDYECFELEDTGLWFRGPAPRLQEGAYFTALGAAQTFGCFTPQPYPRLVAERLGIEALNLGYSGAGPRFFLRHRALLEHINRGRFCVVQVLSARSTSNSLLDNSAGLAYGQRRVDGLTVTAEEVFDDLVQAQVERLPFGTPRMKRGVLRLTSLPLPAVRRVALESRRDWLDSYRELMAAITVPKVLLWFSTRVPDYTPRYHRSTHLLNAYPHLVDRAMVSEVAHQADAYVECTSTRGFPQPLVSRFTNRPTIVDLRDDKKTDTIAGIANPTLYSGVWTKNEYYPSPDMHEDAAATLLPACGPVAR